MLLRAKPDKEATTLATKLPEETKLLKFNRVYTTPAVHPFDQIQWEKRQASIANEKGEIIYKHMGPLTEDIIRNNIIPFL